MRRSLAVALVAIASATVGARADAASFVAFAPTEAEPGGAVTLTLAGPPADAAGGRVRVFLVPNYAVADVKAADDRRLTLVATITPDESGRGSATFDVPELAPGLYAAALDCAGCAAGEWFVAVDALGEDVAPQYRGRLGLTVLKADSSPLWPFAVVGVIVVAVAAALRRRRKGELEA